MQMKTVYTTLLLTQGLILPSMTFSQEATTVQAPSLDLRIPVVDMNDLNDPAKREEALRTLYGAMTTVGFFAVRNTGVDAGVVQRAYAEAEQFYRSPDEFKATCAVAAVKGQRGIVPGETAKGNRVRDYKEFYHFGREGMNPPNVWPEQDGFKEAITTLFSEFEQYVVPLQRAIIASINLEAGSTLDLDLLNYETKNGHSLLRSLYYPAMDPEVFYSLDKPLCWAAAHTDIDYLAILPFATERGLQVEMNGEWLNVVVPHDAFIVNIGDMLQNKTNGLFKSVKHRVMALEPGKDRFSMVFFVHPEDETPLDPLPECFPLTGGVQKFAPGVRREFLWERLIELGIAPGLLSEYAKTGHTERQLKFGKESPQVVQMLVDETLASRELLEALAAR